MKRVVFIFIVIISIIHFTFADVIVLKSGKKVAGVVAKKEDGYELKNEDGQLIGFALDEVEKVVTKPEELTAMADKLFDGAKKLYNEALKLEDIKERNTLYHEGLEKLGKARDVYIETRDIFPQAVYMDKSLQDTMQLVKLFRERLVTEEDVASANVSSKVDKELESKEEAAAEIKEVDPSAEEAKELQPDITSAVLIVSDTEKLRDEGSRAEARGKVLEMLAYKGKTPNKNFASVLDVFLRGDLHSWGFKNDRAIELFQKYIKEANLKDISKFGAMEHMSAARILADAIRDMGTENSEGLMLFVCGHLSSALSAGAKEEDISDICSILGFEKAYFNWGKPLWLALNDARWAILTENYDSGSALLDVTYKDKKDFTVRYVGAYLKILGAISKKSGFDKVLLNLKTLAKESPNTKTREHLESLAKSLDKVKPCAKCEGSGLLKCYKCKGKGISSMKKCPACKGLGEVSIISSSGARRVSICKLCKGIGGQVNVPCELCGGKLSSLKCPECNGDGFKKRVTAKGTMMVDKCELCGGMAVNPKFVEELKYGTGFVQCYKCKGKNANSPPALEDVLSQDICDRCDGLGFPIPKIAYPCGKCLGLGVIIAPVSDPSKKLVD